MEDKLYYSIAEVSKEFNLPYSTLRFWEKEFSKLKPHKNKRGVRYYTKENIELIKQINYLTREKNFTLEGAKKEMRSSKNQQPNQEVLQTLLEAKAFLNEWKIKINHM